MSARDFTAAFQEKLEDTLKEEYRAAKEPNVLVAGRTGVGKSALINAVFGSEVAPVGSGRPVTDSYNEYSSDTTLVSIFDSMGWEGGADKDRKFFDDTKQFLSVRSASTDPAQRIHIIWYALEAPNARFTDFDVRLATEAFARIPILFILTKCEIALDKQIDDLRQAIGNAKISNSVGIVEVAAQPLVRRGQPVAQPFGLKEVVDRTVEMLPDLVRRAFISSQQLNLRLKAQEARSAIVKYASGAFAVGWTPLPFSDSMVLVPLQAAMVAQVAMIYGMSPSGAALSFIGGSMAGMLTTTLGTMLANFLKFIPGLGWLVGGLINSSVAVSITAAMGFATRALMNEIAVRVLSGRGETVTEDWMKSYVAERPKMALAGIKEKGIDTYDEDLTA
jgi:predicted GTPase/uncharacterized protein (DUF697 family)